MSLSKKSSNNFVFSQHGDLMGELKYLNEIKNSDRSPDEKKRVIADMRTAGKKYGFTFREYMLYDFEHRTPEEQFEFISDEERIDIADRLNTDRSKEILGDKFKTYEVFSEFFNRDLCMVHAGEFDKARSFISRHSGFVAKALDDFGGFGIFVCKPGEAGSSDLVTHELFKRFPDGFLIEEYLINRPEFAAFHPASLNTIRIPTVRFDDRIELCHPFVRIGSGGAVVDNASSGGIMGAIDPETGVIFAAADENGGFYDNHPDTGIPIVGFEIPDWDKAVCLAKKLATVLDGQRYCGWDIAPTDKGYLMVEGNAGGMFVWQIPEQKGFRPEASAIIRELGVEYPAELMIP
ncbi:MAG: hypothetical protein K6C36_05795 [Clostridia bacterium]|nr:hypothetical protein [Clostridia bacterium]